MLDTFTAPELRENIHLFAGEMRWDELQDRLAHHFAGPVAKHALGSLIPGHDDALERLADDRVLGGLYERREHAARLLCRFALGDIDDHAGQVGRPAFLIPLRAASRRHPSNGAVRAHQAIIELQGTPFGAQRLGNPLLEAWPILKMSGSEIAI